MRFRNPLTVLSVAGAALLGLAALAPGAGLVPAAQAQDKEPIKIALVQGTSGSPLEVFSRQSQDGFKLGIANLDFSGHHSAATSSGIWRCGPSSPCRS